MTARLRQQLVRTTWTPPPHHLLAGQSIRLKSTSSNNLTPHQQLVELHRLITEARASNSPFHKREVIISYPHLRDLLEIIHDPNVRFHLTPASLTKYISDPSAGSKATSSVSVPKTLIELLEQLASKQIAGNAAKETVRMFLEANGIKPEDEDVYGTFLRVIDRGLDAGFGTTILSKIEWPGDEGSRSAGPSLPNSASGSGSTSTITSSPASSSASSSPSTSTPTSSSPSPSASAASPSPFPTPTAPRNLTRFSCALGKSVDENFGRKIGTERWFASRKLDGIRVLTLLEFFIPHDTSQPIVFDNASFRSRSGNEFTSLARLEEQLRHLAGYPGLRELLQSEPEVIEDRGDGVVKRLVLDGEVCHMVPARGQTIRVGDDGTGASALWEDDGLVEDFQAAVSMVRRNMTMDRPLYFVFDVLNWAEVAAGGPVRGPGLGKTFRARVEDTTNLVGWLRDKIAAEQGGEPRIRGMIQREVQGKEDADAMVQRAMDEGWEGLIFRMDKPYKGKRSTEILKFKKFQDAEYTVVGVDTSRMRLAIGGKFDEYEALSNVWIEHKGHRVNVGTGFTAEERVRFGADPSQIIGKQMTVEYFSESQAVSRDSGVSLRFPRVKKIWEGKRDV